MALILVMTPKVVDAVRTGPAPKFDVVGTVLSAAGLGLVVLGVLQSSAWGWIKPKEDSPLTPFGFSLTLFVVGAGLALLWAFTQWQGRRESSGRDPLVHLALMKIAPLRAGLIGLFSQNLILMGVFFTIPLYLNWSSASTPWRPASRCCRCPSPCSSHPQRGYGCRAASPSVPSCVSAWRPQRSRPPC